MQLNTYVIVSPDGLVYVGLHESCVSAWKIFLGWPTVEEVQQKKDQGWYCAKAEIKWQKPE